MIIITIGDGAKCHIINRDEQHSQRLLRPSISLFIDANLFHYY